jgi:4-aminobutyrate--pyruvate transaminase
MIGHVQTVGPYMQQQLAKFATHPLIGDIRGVGLLTGLEMMADKSTRTPFDPSRKVGGIADKHARAHGLITRFIGDRIAFSPPLIITEAEVDDMVARLACTLDDTWAEVRAN